MFRRRSSACRPHGRYMLLENSMHAELQGARIIAFAHTFHQRLCPCEQVLVVLREVRVSAIVEHHLHTSQQALAKNPRLWSEISTLERMQHTRGISFSRCGVPRSLTGSLPTPSDTHGERPLPDLPTVCFLFLCQLLGHIGHSQRCLFSG